MFPSWLRPRGISGLVFNKVPSPAVEGSTVVLYIVDEQLTIDAGDKELAQSLAVGRFCNDTKRLAHPLRLARRVIYLHNQIQ